MERISSVTEYGYAKINLHLDMLGRLPDGYHSVATVMQTISIRDEVTVIPNESGDFFATCNVEGVPSDEKNIAVRAAKLFCMRTGTVMGGEIRIHKEIPMAAGMAGGSADGAAVLRALNRLREDPLSVEELCEIGSKLGADVPFCIVGGSAYADGKGDVLHPFPEMPDCVIVAACEGEGVSTPWGYGLLDRTYSNFESGCGYTPRSIDGLRNALEKKDLRAVCRNMYNIFEKPILAERPVAANVKRLLLESGAVGAMMSGSGPSVFGVFTDEQEAEQAGNRLKEEGYYPYICHPITF
ncbi:MAG: 4-(cytidine 5'-diphospho)-2-C-methyl-D-erythritol kinase [Clostridia bacterium]|nr:4-(cytidine 5'-diphospho)-2-C-methyl-D-erythritol kinase [Clostridia bacterium]